MSQTVLEKLSDMASEAHAKVQQDHANLNPIVGLSRGMRKSGIPADAVTIDCLQTQKRIIIILHDQHPDILQYQFAFKNKDPDGDFTVMQFSEITAETLYDWMVSYFLAAN
ncbi:MAG: hypothetical protein V2I33_10180 [Kangiellaceae bacterium]|jgi:hypothetical protein|nr:hypothetical protein [Kangiellaceae bacterium]